MHPLCALSLGSAGAPALASPARKWSPAGTPPKSSLGGDSAELEAKVLYFNLKKKKKKSLCAKATELSPICLFFVALCTVPQPVLPSLTKLSVSSFCLPVPSFTNMLNWLVLGRSSKNINSSPIFLSSRLYENRLQSCRLGCSLGERERLVGSLVSQTLPAGCDTISWSAGQPGRCLSLGGKGSDLGCPTQGRGR